MWLKKIVLVLLCCLSLIGCSKPDPVLHDAQSNSIPVSTLKDKWVIVNYWATWCGHCLDEIPELNNFYKNNQNKNVLLLGVSYDVLSLTRLKLAIKVMHIEFPVLTDDPAQELGLSTPSVVPATFIINPKGKVVKKILGPNTEESLTATLHELQLAEQ